MRSWLLGAKPVALRLTVALCFAWMLGACANTKGPPPRDFNELIPRMMGAIGNRTPEDAAANLFNVTSPDERRDAIAYLLKKPYGHEPQYIRAYELLATDPDAMVRAQAMRALGGARSPSVVPTLIKGVNDPDVLVRRDATAALCYSYAVADIAPLAAHLRDDVDDQVRINCAYALRFITTPASVRALIDALDDRNVAVIYSAHQSLTLMTQTDQSFDSKAWLTWYVKTYTPGQ